MKKTAVAFLLVGVGVAISAIGIQDWLTPAVFGQGQGGGHGGPNVTVVNTPLPVAITGAGEPFQTSICYAAFNISCGSMPSSFVVPSTHRLTIEEITLHCETLGTATTLLAAVFRTTVGSNTEDHYFEPAPSIPPVATSNRYTKAHQTRLYADAGSTVEIFVNAFGLDGRRCFSSVSGTLTPQ